MVASTVGDGGVYEWQMALVQETGGKCALLFWSEDPHLHPWNVDHPSCTWTLRRRQSLSFSPLIWSQPGLLAKLDPSVDLENVAEQLWKQKCEQLRLAVVL